METRDNFNLRWDGFEANIKAAFRDVRDEREFSDVTLVVGDGTQAKANKVILASGSSFFFNVLRENPHPLIYLKGVGHNQLLFLLDFLYTGEASIAEEDLNTFLDIAEDLKVKGLTPTGSQTKSNPSISAPLQSQGAAVKPGPSPFPASLQNQVAATEPVARPGIHLYDDISASLQPVQESALQGEVATDELVSSPKALCPPSVTSSFRDNVFLQATSKENHVGINIVKVEVGDDEHCSVAYGSNEHCHISLRGCNVEVLNGSVSNFEISQRNEDFYELSEECQNEGMCLSETQEKNDHVFSIGKKLKQEKTDSSTNRTMSEVVDNEQLNYDWYESGEENNRTMQAKQKEDDYFEVDKLVNSLGNFDGKQEILDANSDMDAAETVDNEQSTHARDERKKFSQPNNLKTQEKINTAEKRYECEVCFKKFSKRGNFKTHERIHTGEKPFQCSICFKRFSQMGNLKTHKAIHTGEKPYQCEVCFKTFSRLQTLQDHEGIHTGENPYPCLQCTKKFSRPSHLKIHERVHTGEKPYQCVICFKRFYRVNHLNRHKGIHNTGEKKPYQCGIWFKRFSRIDTLNKHKGIHNTGEKPDQ